MNKIRVEEKIYTGRPVSAENLVYLVQRRVYENEDKTSYSTVTFKMYVFVEF